jgi:hypothetical protein
MVRSSKKEIKILPKKKQSNAGKKSIKKKIIFKPPPIESISNPIIANPKILNQYRYLDNAWTLKDHLEMKKRMKLRESKKRHIIEKQTQNGCIIC